MSETIVLGKKIVKLPKKECDRCQDNRATRKDDHLQDCCEECWEGLMECVCWCGFEFRGHWETDCCPKCKHNSDDPECPCGCKEEDGEEQTCDECGDHREGSEGHWECVEDAEGDERVLCDACYENAGRPNDE